MKNKNKTSTNTNTSMESDIYKRRPNEDHRAHRWAGARVERNKKKYTRKDKYGSKYLDGRN